MKDEVYNSNTAVEGLYQDPASKQYFGALDVNQAAAVVRAGFKLVEEGVEAALLTTEEIAQKFGKAVEEVVADVKKTATKKTEETK